jgi:hypothetical protein
MMFEAGSIKNNTYLRFVSRHRAYYSVTVGRTLGVKNSALMNAYRVADERFARVALFAKKCVLLDFVMMLDVRWFYSRQ